MESTGKSSSSINIDIITETDCSHADINDKEPLLSASTDGGSQLFSLLHQWSLGLKCMLRHRQAYKIKLFSSRGAFLVLILNFLVSAGYGVPAGNGNSYHFYEDPHQQGKGADYSDEPKWIIRDIIPILVWSPSILLLGLLADLRYGR